MTPTGNIESRQLALPLDSRIKARGQPGREGRLSAKSVSEMLTRNTPSLHINPLIRLPVFLRSLSDFCMVVWCCRPYGYTSVLNNAARLFV